jgi:hypothetical protein
VFATSRIYFSGLPRLAYDIPCASAAFQEAGFFHGFRLGRPGRHRARRFQRLFGVEIAIASGCRGNHGSNSARDNAMPKQVCLGVMLRKREKMANVPNWMNFPVRRDACSDRTSRRRNIFRLSRALQRNSGESAPFHSSL